MRALKQNPICHTMKGLNVFIFPFFLPFSLRGWGAQKANWKRRAEIIDYCVHVVDEAQVRQSDHHPGDNGSHHPPLSVGLTDGTKVRV